MNEQLLVPIASVKNGTLVLRSESRSPEDLKVIEVDGTNVRCEYKSFGRIETCYVPAKEYVQVIAC